MKKENLIDEKEIIKNLTYLIGDKPEHIWEAIFVHIEALKRQELQKIAEDVIGEEEDTKYEEDNLWVKFYQGKNEKRKELIDYFKSIGVEIK